MNCKKKVNNFVRTWKWNDEKFADFVEWFGMSDYK